MAAPTSEIDRQESLFDGGPEGDLEFREPGPDPAQDPDPAPQPNPELERLQRELVERDAQLASERERLDRFLQQPAAPHTPPPAAAAPTPMPDAAVDPEAFQRWLTEDQNRREATLRQEMSQQNAHTEAVARAHQLRQEFVTDFPHLKDVLEYADVEFRQRCPDGVIPADTAPLKRAIAQALEEKTGRRPATPATRTGGVSAGSEPRTKPKQQREEVGPDDGSLVDCIKEIQSKSGLYG